MFGLTYNVTSKMLRLKFYRPFSATEKLKKQSVINLQPIFRSTNTNHAKAMLSATIAVFFTVAPAGRNPYMGRARFELRTGVTINEETTPENNKQKKLYVFL
ncbi:hypothetical protein TNCV_5110821 [Trichonephila clavipes]|nr:hypothetical protein TNCV_5110821 [Trichonephila clavipes]